MPNGNLWGEITRVHGWIVIDAQDMELVRSALRQGRRDLAGGHSMGTVALPILERSG
jgi:hypothetical protein